MILPVTSAVTTGAHRRNREKLSRITGDMEKGRLGDNATPGRPFGLEAPQFALAAAFRLATRARLSCLGFIRVFPLVPRLIFPRFERLSPRPMLNHLLNFKFVHLIAIRWPSKL